MCDSRGGSFVKVRGQRVHGRASTRGGRFTSLGPRGDPMAQTGSPAQWVTLGDFFFLVSYPRLSRIV